MWSGCWMLGGRRSEGSPNSRPETNATPPKPRHSTSLASTERLRTGRTRRVRTPRWRRQRRPLISPKMRPTPAHALACPAQAVNHRNMSDVEVVVAHSERATLRVGDVFLKIDGDQARTDVEVEAMAMVPVPTAEILWRR